MELEITFNDNTKDFYKGRHTIELANNWLHINGKTNLILQESDIKKFLIVK